MAFSQRKIYFVIALTVIALVGIVMVQYFWIGAAFKIQEDKFNQRFLTVRDQLEKTIKADSSLQKSLNTFISFHSDSSITPSTSLQSRVEDQLKVKVDSLFQKEFTDISYEFGLVKHHHNIDSSKKENVLFSTMEGTKTNISALLKSRYKTCKCLTEGQYHFNFYFPNKNHFIAAQIWEMLGLSILCILLVVGCFAYTIITIRKQKKLAQIKNDFINNMTHELKTPIFSISVASKALGNSKEISQSKKLNKYLNLIKNENKRLQRQVNKVLQMALVDADKSHIEKQEIDLHALIQRVVKNFELILSNQNGAVHFNLNATKHVIRADETHLSNIIHNLIDNAIKYSKNQPDITITTTNKKDGVSFSITDNGIGMNSKTKKHIFDKFYRAQTGDIHDVKGFGLGLSYVKDIVEAHEGWIKLKSKPHQGSKFTIFLPA